LLATRPADLAAPFDALIVGAGAAGLYAALCLPESWRVAIASKSDLKIGASDWAQGGIAAALHPDDSPHLHFNDTLRAGAGLCDPAAVRFLVERAAGSIERLLHLGVEFDRHDSALATTLEAAHSRPRVLHAADTTGRAIVATLTERALARPNICAIPRALVLRLWQNATGCCQGAQVLWGDRVQWVSARAVVLATGGGGQLFAHTTNPAVSTGDGVALAWRAGALLRNLEFVQFHPTALHVPGAPRFLISEAVRGEGAHLVDAAGDRFAFQYHPDGELAPRDVVSRAIYTHLQKTAPDPAEARVFLDMRVIDRDRVRQRFPNIIAKCQRWGVDVFAEPVPVSPAAHYWMGGVAVGLDSQTSIPGLYAVGEVANTGVHGANRLASNSLLECLVYGERLVEMDLASDLELPPAANAPPPLELPRAERDRLEAIRAQLPVLVWDSAGICRDATALAAAIARVQAWQQECAAFEVTQAIATDGNWHLPSETACHLRVAAETTNLLDAAALLLRSALFRTESRGGHYRRDFPATDPNWNRPTLARHGEIWREAIAADVPFVAE